MAWVAPSTPGHHNVEPETTGFLDPGQLAFTELLESSYEAIKAELLGVMSLKRWGTYVDHNQQLGKALLYLLYVRGKPNTRNCRLCPTTSSVLAQIPNIRQAVFGYLPPGGRIAPHRGAPGILRVHLGVLAESGAAGWKAEGRSKLCEQGKVTVFDDGSLHEAWNDGLTPRVTLICDPPAPHLDEAGVQEALRQYEGRYGLGYLMRTYGKSKRPDHPYNRLALPALLSMERWASRAEPWVLPFVLSGYNRFLANHAPVPYDR